MNKKPQTPAQQRATRAFIACHTPTLRGTYHAAIDDYRDDEGNTRQYTFGIINVSYWDVSTQSWLAHKDLLVTTPHGFEIARSEFRTRLYAYLPRRFHTFVRLELTNAARN